MRFVRGFFALIVLSAGLVGVPWALLTLGGNPLPDQFSLAALGRALLRPDDGTVLIGLITIIGWIAWFVFALSVLTELVAVISRQRIRIPLPGLRGVQRGVGVLLVLVVAMLVLPHPHAAAAPSAPPSGPTRSAPATPGPTATATTSPASSHTTAPSHTTARASRGVAAPGTQRVPAQAKTPTVVHVVRPGDELWTLAEHYYGHGREWRKIAEANPHLLTGGPDKLQVGWKLMIPSPQQSADQKVGEDSIRVHRGDTLSGIAEDAYGDAQAWPGLYQANRAEIADPDLIDIGEQLRLPAQVSSEAGTFTRLDQQDAEPAKKAQAAERPALQQQEEQSQEQPPDDRATPSTSASPSASGSASPSASASPTASPSATPTTEANPAGQAQPAPSQAPGQAAPSQAAPSQAAPSQAAPSQAVPAEVEDASVEPIVLAGIGGLLAAGLVGGLALRRRIQLQTRPVGRRIAHAPAPAQLTEAQLGRRQTPLGLSTLDLALRSVGLHCLRTGQPLPLLQAARVGIDEIELCFSDQPDAPWPEPPTGFRSAGRRWLLDAADAGYLAKLPGIDSAPQPYPGLTPVGVDADEVQLLVNLELAGLITLDDQSAGEPDERIDRESDAAGETLRAMAGALAFCPWSDEVIVTVVGGDRRLVDAVGSHTVSYSDDLDRLLDRWEQRAATQRRHLDGQPAQNHRIDPDLADPWVPEIALVDTAASNEQMQRLEELVLSRPPVTMAAVLREGAVREGVAQRPADTAWRLRLDAATPARRAHARLDPLGWVFEPQQLSAEVAESLRDLLAATGSELTTPAPWWNEPVSVQPAPAARPVDQAFSYSDIPSASSEITSSPDTTPSSPDAPEPVTTELDPPVAPRRGWPMSPVPSAAFTDPASNVTFIGPTAGRRVASEESATVDHPAAAGPSPVRHPSVQLLGPIELLGAAGETPPRAGKQCIEYCAWLLEHPGRSAREMAAALVVAEGTRRSNMSRLRAWLGEDADGAPYLPDAYSGRIMLSAVVSSDWHRLQILTGPGVNATSTEGLQAALSLVRGAPLADAAPGQWYWAEEMRTDMVSVIRDIGVELSSRALADKDLELARWAASRSLTAAPHDERLLAMRIRIEHQAGNLAEVERLSLQMSAHARLLGLDLDPETVDLLQQVMEGQVRARA